MIIDIYVNEERYLISTHRFGFIVSLSNRYFSVIYVVRDDIVLREIQLRLSLSSLITSHTLSVCASISAQL